MRFLKSIVLLGVVLLLTFETASAQSGNIKWKPFAEGKHLYWNSPTVLELRDPTNIAAIVKGLKGLGHSVDALNQTTKIIVLMFGDVLKAEDILIFYRGEKNALYTYSLQAEKGSEKLFIDFLKGKDGGICRKPSYLNEIRFDDYFAEYSDSDFNKNRNKMVKFLRVLHNLWEIDGINSMSLKFWNGKVVSARNVPKNTTIKEVAGVNDQIHYDIRNKRVNNLYVPRKLSTEVSKLNRKVVRIWYKDQDKIESVDTYSQIGKGLVNLYVDNAGNAVQVKLPGDDFNWMDGQSFPIRKLPFDGEIGEEELKSSRDFFNLGLLNPAGVTTTMNYNTEVEEHPVSRILTPTINLGKYADFTSIIYVKPIGTPGGAPLPSPDDLELVVGLWSDSLTNKKFITDIFGINNLPDYVIDGNTRNMKVTFAEGKIERGYWTKVEKPDIDQVLTYAVDSSGHNLIIDNMDISLSSIQQAINNRPSASDMIALPLQLFREKEYRKLVYFMQNNDAGAWGGSSDSIIIDDKITAELDFMERKGGINPDKLQMVMTKRGAITNYYYSSDFEALNRPNVVLRPMVPIINQDARILNHSRELLYYQRDRRFYSPEQTGFIVSFSLGLGAGALILFAVL